MRHPGQIKKPALVLYAQVSIAGMDKCAIILMLIHLPHQRARGNNARQWGTHGEALRCYVREELFRAYAAMIAWVY